MDLTCSTFVESYLTTLDRPFLRFLFSQPQARNQGYSDPEAVCNTPRPRDVSKNQIWDYRNPKFGLWTHLVVVAKRPTYILWYQLF